MNNQRIVAAMLAVLTIVSANSNAQAADDASPIRVIFLGDNGHHRPADRFAQLQPVLQKRGIELTYGEMSAITAENLAKYDGLAIYANTERIEPAQEAAIVDFVEGGKGLIPLHCASFCFLNSDKYIELVGAQFERHGTGTFRTRIVEPEHPIMKGFRGFESWDETYVHRRHNEKDRTVLEVREDAERSEPWTWVRTQGKGRVFYTAWGHDERTFGNRGFHNLVERGIRWATGRDPQAAPSFVDRPEMTKPRKDVKPFEYVEANVPHYTAGAAWGTQEQGPSKMQLPLSPEESQKHIVTPVDFEAQLFVSEPELQGKPIAINWDERGRLWVCETVDYPNEMQRKGEGRDRIRICEDTDNDGKADKFTVFADKLSIPTSLTFARGGVIVLQAPDTLFLKDTNGDDVADERSTLFTGWATNDTHAGPSNLQYGLDNWIYGMVGYAGFEGTVGGEKHSFRQGFYRFKPDGSKLEFLRSTNNNSWGVGISEDGVLFGSTANNNPSEYMPIANRYYERVRGWSPAVLGGIADSARFEPITPNVRQMDNHGNFSAAAGHALYTARVYPKEYWNRAAFVNGPEGHLTATFVITPDGSGFKSKNSWNLFASDDEWTAPTIAEVGPDGNVWVVDWYNYIVQHNPVPTGFKNGKGNAYETDLRDKTHGRIYRVVYKPAKPAPPLSLAGASPEKLVETLKNDNFFWRRHAQRLLVERGETDVAPALTKLVQDDSVDEIGLNVGAVHALWALHGLRDFEPFLPTFPEPLQSGLSHTSAAVRRATIQVAPSVELLTNLVDEDLEESADSSVRLTALLALADTPSDWSTGNLVAALLRAPNIATDRWLADAITSAGAAHDIHFLRGVCLIGEPFDAQKANEAISRVAEHYARGAPAATIGELIGFLDDAPSTSQGAILNGLAKGWPKNAPLKLTPEQDDAIVALFKSLPADQRSPLITLAKRWGSQKLEAHAAEIAADLIKQLQNEGLDEADRIAAATQLVEFRAADDEAAAAIVQQITPRSSPELAAGLFTALGKSDATSVGPALVEQLPKWTPSMRPAAYRLLLSKGDWTEALIAAAEQGQARLADLALDQKQALAAHPDKQLAARAKKLLASGGGLPNADRQKVLDELKPLVNRTGDAIAGKQIFTRQCAKCHMHSGEGNKIGPDLTGMAVHPKIELLTHIIDPSRSVEGNFRAYAVQTSKGQVLTGLLTSESKTSIELTDAEGKKHALQRDDIDQLITSPKSLMPDGFEKQVPADDIVNLLEFLTQRGKYLPIPLDKVATVVSTKGMFFEPEGDVERMIFDDWKPKIFDGVPFLLVDPQDDRVPNAVLLYGPQGKVAPRMPKSVSLPCNAAAGAIHLLSGVSGWGAMTPGKRGVTMVVRLHYEGGATEDHELLDGVHFADYIRRIDVPGSKFAFSLRNQQLRYLSVKPRRTDKIATIELLKGNDNTAPIVMAVTVEAP